MKEKVWGQSAENNADDKYRPFFNIQKLETIKGSYLYPLPEASEDHKF